MVHYHGSYNHPTRGFTPVLTRNTKGIHSLRLGTELLHEMTNLTQGFPPTYVTFNPFYYYKNPHLDILRGQDKAKIRYQCPQTQIKCISVIWKRESCNSS